MFMNFTFIRRSPEALHINIGYYKYGENDDKYSNEAHDNLKYMN